MRIKLPGLMACLLLMYGLGVSKEIRANDIAGCGMLGIFGKMEMFVSVKEFEVGNTQSGVVLGNWSLRFEGAEVVWHHSDLYERMSYTCREGILFLNNLPVHTTLDRQGIILVITMGDVDYAKK